MLWIRRKDTALAWGRYQPVEVGNRDCFVYLREAGDQRRLIALNFTNNERRLNVPGLEAGRILLSTYLDREGEVQLSNLHLRPSEGLLITL